MRSSTSARSPGSNAGPPRAVIGPGSPHRAEPRRRPPIGRHVEGPGRAAGDHLDHEGMAGPGVEVGAGDDPGPRSRLGLEHRAAVGPVGWGVGQRGAAQAGVGPALHVFDPRVETMRRSGERCRAVVIEPTSRRARPAEATGQRGPPPPAGGRPVGAGVGSQHHAVDVGRLRGGDPSFGHVGRDGGRVSGQRVADATAARRSGSRTAPPPRAPRRRPPSTPAPPDRRRGAAAAGRRTGRAAGRALEGHVRPHGEHLPDQPVGAVRAEARSGCHRRSGAGRHRPGLGRTRSLAR